MPDKATEGTASGRHGPASPSSPSTQISICLNLLDDIQDQIRAADTKAGFISMLNVFLFGFIATNFETIRGLCASGKNPGTATLVATILTVSLYLAFTVASLVLVVTCVMSRFAERVPESRVFFGHIAKRYSLEPAKYAKIVSHMTDSQWVEELGIQVAEVSSLALIKHRRIRWATLTTLASVMLWLLALVIIVGIRWLSV
jgi:hypothetical protein